MLELLFNIVAGLQYCILLQKGGLQLYYKKIPTQVLSCEYCDIFKNTYFEEHLRTAASILLIIKLIINIGHLPTPSELKNNMEWFLPRRFCRSGPNIFFADC